MSQPYISKTSQLSRALCSLSLIGLALAATACTTTSAPSEPASRLAAQSPLTQFTSDRVIVTTVGSGPDVVLIPGLSSAPNVWESTTAALPGYRYHYVQVKGFAGAAPEANASGPVVAPVAAEIARYIRDQRLDKPALVGHSMGGSLAMLVATQNPDLIGKIMVVDMMPFMGAMFGPPGATAASVEPVAAGLRTMLASAPEDVRRTQTEGAIAGMIRTEANRAAAVRDSLASDPAVSAQAMYDLITTDQTAELAKITVPFSVLYVTPTGAPISDAQMDAYYQAAYRFAPQARVQRVADSAHFIMWDNPEVFVATLREFLR